LSLFGARESQIRLANEKSVDLVQTENFVFVFVRISRASRCLVFFLSRAVFFKPRPAHCHSWTMPVMPVSSILRLDLMCCRIESSISLMPKILINPRPQEMPNRNLANAQLYCRRILPKIRFWICCVNVFLHRLINCFYLRRAGQIDMFVEVVPNLLHKLLSHPFY